jgi:hypothetical protein
MPHEIRYRQVEIPELDAFLDEYAALCRKHGMQFKTDENQWEGGAFTTLEAVDRDPVPYLNLEYADENIPCIARAREQVDRERARDEEKDARREAAQAKIRERELYLRLKAKYEGANG